MDFKVKQDSYNALLKRKEVYVEVNHDKEGTPSRLDLRKALANKYGAKPENVYVVGVDTKTGTESAICEIHVYDDTETALRIVPKHIQIRNLPPDERKRMREQAAKKEEGKPKAEKPAKPEKATDEKAKEEKPKAEAKPPTEAQKKGKEEKAK
jgi:small subunit ribosomal protein S24e